MSSNILTCGLAGALVCIACVGMAQPTNKVTTVKKNTPSKKSTSSKVEWMTDFSKASAEAKADNKYLLMDFSGSDWCGWCIKLDEEVFSKKAFKEFAKSDLVCVLVDFPNSKKLPAKLVRQNEELKNKYKIGGFPTVILLSPDGELAGETGYQDGGPEKYVEHLKKMIEEHKQKAK
jgi:thioredoxin-related protein